MSLASKSDNIRKIWVRATSVGETSNCLTSVKIIIFCFLFVDTSSPYERVLEY